MSQGGVTDRVLGGWYVSGILTYHSGLPTEVYSSCPGTAGDVLFAGCNFTGLARVNVVPGVSQTNKSHFNPATTPFWNPAAFTVPAPFTFGNEGRSLPSARTFGFKNEDFTLGKKTHLYGERGTIDFRASFFNVFNRHIFQAPGGVRSQPKYAVRSSREAILKTVRGRLLADSGQLPIRVDREPFNLG